MTDLANEIVRNSNSMTYQQLFLTMCCSVGLLYVFVYIIGVDMLVVEEIPYSPHLEMSSHTTEVKYIYAAYLVIYNVL